jgi:hypothetical protein
MFGFPYDEDNNCRCQKNALTVNINYGHLQRSLDASTDSTSYAVGWSRRGAFTAYIKTASTTTQVTQVTTTLLAREND